MKKPSQKRRGRKPKGGKVVEPIEAQQAQQINNVAIIAHLKCHTKDIPNKDTLQYNPHINEIEPYYTEVYNLKIDDMDCIHDDHSMKSTTKKSGLTSYDEKLNSLNFLLENIDCSKIDSACFWCTCSFSTEVFHIPKSFTEDVINAYGCFCSPECGMAFLLNENLDESTKVERIALMNSVYCSPCSYTKNIQPALSPYYTLNKFFGNLSIEEYRKICNTNTSYRYKLVDKPFTLTNPEFCIDHSNM